MAKYRLIFLIHCTLGKIFLLDIKGTHIIIMIVQKACALCLKVWAPANSSKMPFRTNFNILWIVKPSSVCFIFIIIFLQGRHALVYDINTANETWEWVDLKEVSGYDFLAWTESFVPASHYFVQQQC